MLFDEIAGKKVPAIYFIPYKIILFEVRILCGNLALNKMPG